MVKWRPSCGKRGARRQNQRRREMRLFAVMLLAVATYGLTFAGAAVAAGIAGEAVPSGWVVLGACIGHLVLSVVYQLAKALQ